ncbi:MAG: leucyl aminopeptidase [Pseudomonadota bacterium]
MRCVARRQSPSRLRCDLLVLPLTSGELKKVRVGPLAELDRSLEGALRQAVDDDGFTAAPDQTLALRTQRLIPARRVALLGLGANPPSTVSDLRRLASRCVRVAVATRARRLALVLPASLATLQPAPEVGAALVEGAQLALYRFDRYKRRSTRDHELTDFIVVLPPGEPTISRPALARGEVLARATMLARDLVNEPASHMTPRRLAEQARQGSRQLGLTVRVHDRASLRRLRMGLLEAVSRGSHEPPCVVHLRHRPARHRGPRVVLVGKGITFDAGGLDIKPAASMLGMKSDMAGAAAVLAAMRAVAELKLPLEVHAFLACSENMLGSAAFKPGDVVRSRAGLSVEIGNTDAEGRLVLADTFSLAATVKPELLVDLATLTGACVVALGPHCAGLFSADDSLASDLGRAGALAGEPSWRLPLDDSLRDQLKSPIADLKNTGGRYGGAITAALFLREFVPEGVRWAHLDIAGPAFSDSARDHISKGGTGFGVATLVRFLEGLAHPKKSDL